MELGGVFCYGPDYKDRIEELTSNNATLETPLWYNPPFSLQIKKIMA